MVQRRSLAALPVIAALVLGLYLVCAVLAFVAGLPADLGLPWPVRLLGIPLVAYGAGMAAWVFLLRGPGTVLDSTWITLRKLLRRMPLDRASGRAEPLVVTGPYRFVRHPLYSGVDGLAFGFAMVSDHPWAYLGAVALACWFAVVLAPFEERELAVLFGTPYQAYCRSVRRFLPLRRRPQ